jgi:hypothetical protein
MKIIPKIIIAQQVHEYVLYGPLDKGKIKDSITILLEQTPNKKM